MSTYGAHPEVWNPATHARRAAAPRSGRKARPSAQEPRLIRFTRRGRVAGVVAVLVVTSGVMAGVAGLPARIPAWAERTGSGDSSNAASAPSRHVVVVQGDSLWEIALRLRPESDPRETVVRLRRLNGLRSNLIQPGQVLLVPGDV